MKIKVLMPDGTCQYVVRITSRYALVRSNIAFSPFPHRALSATNLDKIKSELPEFEFILGD